MARPRLGAGGKLGMKPLISVLLPCYNSAAILPMALASLVAHESPDIG